MKQFLLVLRVNLPGSGYALINKLFDAPGGLLTTNDLPRIRAEAADAASRSTGGRSVSPEQVTILNVIPFPVGKAPEVPNHSHPGIDMLRVIGPAQY